MFFLLIVPLILAMAVEAVLWKKNSKGPFVSLLGTSFWALVVTVAIWGISFAWMDDQFANVTWGFVGWVSVLALFNIAALAFWVLLMRNLRLSLSQPLSLIKIVAATALSWAIFGDDLGVWEIVLVGTIFGFCVALAYFQGRHEQRERREDYTRGLAFLLCWGIFSVGANLMVRHISGFGVNAITFTGIRYIIVLLMVFMIIGCLYKRRTMATFVSVLRDRIHISIGALIALMSTLWVTLTVGMNVGVLMAIVYAYMPIVIIYSAIVMRERLRWYSYVLIVGLLAATVTLTLLSA
ncbi:MAG: hypothetical protein FWE38_02570 [Firmicutes bacterium]|nr:hypothetical protein [Bacillota bacterium]